MASVNKNTGKGRDNRDRAHISCQFPQNDGSQILSRKILELSLISENCFSQVVSRDRQAVSAGALRVRTYNVPLFRFLHDLKIGCTEN